MCIALQSQASAIQSLHFPNFGKEVELIAGGDNYFVKNPAGPGLNVIALASRLIIKTDSGFSREKIRDMDNRIRQVTELYIGKDFAYFLAELNDIDDLLPVSEKVKRNTNVLLVQPDILQLKITTALADHVIEADVSYMAQLPIRALWQQTRGSGVKLAIIDDGIDLSHPAFAGVNVAFAYDTESRQLNARPQRRIDHHGTRVAGVIFARAGPGAFSSLHGIAPDAQLIAIRQPDSWTSNTLLAFHLAQLANADIINCSWHTNFLLQPIADVVNDLAVHGRGGKGVAVIFAAGNDSKSLAGFSTEARIGSAITVGALDATGMRLASSNFGSDVDLSVYGAGIKSTANHHKYQYFSGTSLSAAIVSGVAALFLSNEPDLTLPQLVAALQNMHTQREDVFAEANHNIRNTVNVDSGTH